MGKRDSRRHSTTGFSENVVVAGTSYQILDVLSFCYRERPKPSTIKINSLIFQVKKSTMKLSRLLFESTWKNLKLNPVLVLVFKSKALCYKGPYRYISGLNIYNIRTVNIRHSTSSVTDSEPSTLISLIRN